MSLQVYYDRTNYSEAERRRLSSPGSLRARPAFSADSLDTYDVDFQHHFSVGDRNQITWGAGYRFTHDQNDNAPTFGILPGPPEPESATALLCRTKSSCRKICILPWGRRSSITIIPGLKFSRAAGCNGMSRPSRCFGPPSRARCGHPRASTMIWYEPTGSSLPVSSRSRASWTARPAFTSETLIAYEAGLSRPARGQGFRLRFDLLQRLQQHPEHDTHPAAALALPHLFSK